MEIFIDKQINKLKPNKYFRFFIGVKQAQAEREYANLQAIMNARDGQAYMSEKIIMQTPDGQEVTKEVMKYAAPQWTAAAWLLERTEPEIYGKRDFVKGDVNHQHNVQHKIELDESPERLAGILGVLIQSIPAGLIELRKGQSGTYEATDSEN